MFLKTKDFLGLYTILLDYLNQQDFVFFLYFHLKPTLLAYHKETYYIYHNVQGFVLPNSQISRICHSTHIFLPVQQLCILYTSFPQKNYRHHN